VTPFRSRFAGHASWAGEASARFGGRALGVAAVEMIVDQTHRLHEGVHGRRAHEPPAAALEVLGQRRGVLGAHELGQSGAVQPAGSSLGSSPSCRLENLTLQVKEGPLDKPVMTMSGPLYGPGKVNRLWDALKERRKYLQAWAYFAH